MWVDGRGCAGRQWERSSISGVWVCMWSNCCSCCGEMRCVRHRLCVRHRRCCICAILRAGLCRRLRCYRPSWRGCGYWNSWDGGYVSRSCSQCCRGQCWARFCLECRWAARTEGSEETCEERSIGWHRVDVSWGDWWVKTGCCSRKRM